MKRLNNERQKELALIYQKLVINAIMFAIVIGKGVFLRNIIKVIPSFSAASTLAVYSFYSDLEAYQVFPILSSFIQLRLPLLLIPNALNALADYRVAMDRLVVFLNSSEVDPPRQIDTTQDPEFSIIVCSFFL